MRNRHATTTILHWLLIAMSLVCGSFPGLGLSVCVAADGDLAIEARPSGETCSGCLPSHSDPGANDRPSRGLSDSHGCDCTDIALPATQVPLQSKQAAGISWLVRAPFSLPPTSPSLAWIPTDRTFRPERFPLRQASPSRLRTVVLLV